MVCDFFLAYLIGLVLNFGHDGWMIGSNFSWIIRAFVFDIKLPILFYNNEISLIYCICTWWNPCSSPHWFMFKYSVDVDRKRSLSICSMPTVHKKRSEPSLWKHRPYPLRRFSNLYLRAVICSENNQKKHSYYKTVITVF